MIRFAIIALILITVPTTTFASSVLRSGSDISIASDQAVEGDFYGLSNSASVSGGVLGDLLIAAAKLSVNGKVGSDLAVVASTVDIHGEIGDDARIVAAEVTIAGDVKGDLVVLASNLKVLSTAKISGDLIFFGTNAEISGEVGKSVLGTSENMRIDGVVLGDVDIKTNNLSLGERTNVTGMVKYVSVNELVRAQNARVAGKIVKNDPVMVQVSSLKDVLVPLLVVLFTVLAWFLFFRQMLERVVSQADRHPLRNMLIGFGVFFLTPIATTILIVSTLGSIIGLTFFFVYLVLLIVTMIVSGVVAGAFLAKLVSKTSATVSIPYVLIGTIATFSMLYIPVVGPIVLVALWFTTLGAISVYIYRLIRFS